MASGLTSDSAGRFGVGRDFGRAVSGCKTGQNSEWKGSAEIGCAVSWPLLKESTVIKILLERCGDPNRC